MQAPNTAPSSSSSFNCPGCEKPTSKTCALYGAWKDVMKEKKAVEIQRRQIELRKEMEAISAQEEQMDYERQLQMALTAQKSDLDLQLQQALKGQKFEFDAKITKVLKESTTERNKIVYELNSVTEEKKRLEDEIRELEMKLSHTKTDYENQIQTLHYEKDSIMEEFESKLSLKENELIDMKERESETIRTAVEEAIIANVAVAAEAANNKDNNDNNDDSEDRAHEAAMWEEHIAELETELKEVTAQKDDQRLDYETKIKMLQDENRKLVDEWEIKLEQKEEEFLERSTEQTAINVTSDHIKSLESELRDSNLRLDQQRDHYEVQITALEDRCRNVENEWELKLIQKEQDLIDAKEKFLKRNEEEDAATAALIASSTIELEKELCIAQMKLADMEDDLRKVQRERDDSRRQNAAEKQELEKEIEFLEEEMYVLKDANRQHQQQWNNGNASFRNNNGNQSFRR